MSAKNITAAVITISDRSAAGLREDVSGPLAVKLLKDAGVDVLYTGVTRDDVRSIAEEVQTAAIHEVDLVFTTGGTGIAPQDFTARAMDTLLRFDIPGIAEAIRYEGWKRGVYGAALSRGRAGVLVTGLHRVLVVNAPGSPNGVKDALNVLLPMLEHTVSQMHGDDH
ncbi:molybdenum cofactor synthesis domain-containing protein [Arcanobacterium pluranimalium]|uniref:MogA/MoaB family molybdenum cofactor biosynthesis protein n=1 Tax=Arcanobacterium pluranimalium TaxID=108028 RepID=UPI0019560FF9|nr:MogA/MoaB family molybdenum cofactor biosynthesis protein [Arcanobacterium pluranimalium]MBM7824541.1 molybdenum cofactor synthesis domain-containing protein [Arcanobacterium pluranimalium]